MFEKEMKELKDWFQKVSEAPKDKPEKYEYDNPAEFAVLCSRVLQGCTKIPIRKIESKAELLEKHQKQISMMEQVVRSVTRRAKDHPGGKRLVKVEGVLVSVAVGGRRAGGLSLHPGPGRLKAMAERRAPQAKEVPVKKPEVKEVPTPPRGEEKLSPLLPKSKKKKDK